MANASKPDPAPAPAGYWTRDMEGNETFVPTGPPTPRVDPNKYYRADDPIWSDPWFGGAKAVESSYGGALWGQVLPAFGFQGDIYTPNSLAAPAFYDDSGGYQSTAPLEYTPEARQAIQKLRDAGYDIVTQFQGGNVLDPGHALVGPDNKVLQSFEQPSQFKEFLKVGAPMVLGALAGVGAFNPLFGGAIPANAAVGAINAGIQGNNLLTGALTGGIKGAVGDFISGAGGIAEGMAPGVLAAASPAELAAINALVNPSAVTNALATGAQTFPVTDVSIPAQTFPVEPQAPVTVPPYDRLPTTDLYADLAGAATAPPVLPPTVGGADLYADLAAPSTVTNALTTAPSGLPLENLPPPPQVTTSPVADIPVTEPPYDRLPTTDLYADLAGATVAPPTVGGADLYADLAGATVAPPTVGGADLYADLAGAETVAPPPSSFRPSENYGPGMTGAQTSAYDTVVDLTGSPGLASAAASGAGVLENIGNATGLTSMSNAADAASAGSIWAPLISSLASLYGGSQAAGASTEAAQIAAAAADRAIDLQRRMYEEGVARQQPFYQAGVNALTQLQQRTGAMPPAFTGQVDLTRDPGYAFRLSEGLKGLERSAAARGGLMSGATGKALTRFGQEAASQEYQNAYNRALTEYNAARQRESEEYNRLSGLAGTGGTTAQQIGVAGQQMASNVGNIGMQQGSTAANALLSGAAARQSAYGDVGRAWGQYFAPQPVINYLGGRPYGG